MKRITLFYVQFHQVTTTQAEKVKGQIHLHPPLQHSWTDSPFKKQALGVSLVDAKVFMEALSLNTNGKRMPCTVILPDSWIRTMILPVEDFPQKEEEQEELLQWKLKKVLPIDPHTLRISYHILSEDVRGTKNLLLHLALDSLLNTIEDTLEAQKGRVGRISTPFWILSSRLPKDSSWGLLTLEEDIWTLGLFSAGELLLFRQRYIAPGDWEGMLEETQRSITYFMKHFSKEQPKLYIWAPSVETTQRLADTMPLDFHPLAHDEPSSQLPHPLQVLFLFGASHEL